jgi:hypothetical protein
MLDDQQIARNFATGLATATRFFMGEADVQRAARRIATALGAIGVPYAIAGGLAVAAHGHLRVTVDVDILMTAEGLARFKARWLGLGWIERFPGSRGMRDAESNVPIDVLITGDYPGDGKPKAVVFPDPAAVGIQVDGTSVLSLLPLIELKIAAGLSSPDRLQDFADVIALIRANDLPEAFGTGLDPSIRDKYAELWTYAQIRRGES